MPHLDPYDNFVRPFQRLAWYKSGCSKAEVDYQTAILDAEHHCEERWKVTKRILWCLRFIPYVRNLLDYWSEYEATYVYTTDVEAREYYLQLPDNVIPFPQRK